jgi:hypothetical protein
VDDGASPDGPPRRRGSWNLKSIVEDVAGRPIDDFQDPDRPVHPYLKDRLDRPRVPSPREAGGAGRVDDPDRYDPVAHLYPPLVGAHGRAYHGPDNEHHAETIERHRPEPVGEGLPARPPGPSHRPERIYLHYLLLHMDRLSDSGLHYLKVAVDEEIAHRSPRSVAVAAPVVVPAPSLPSPPVDAGPPAPPPHAEEPPPA